MYGAAASTIAFHKLCSLSNTYHNRIRQELIYNYTTHNAQTVDNHYLLKQVQIHIVEFSLYANQLP